MIRLPSEVQFLNVYLPPSLLVFVGGLLVTLVLTQALNATGLGRLFWHPPLAFVAMWVIASSWIGLLFVTP